VFGITRTGKVGLKLLVNFFAALKCDPPNEYLAHFMRVNKAALLEIF